MKNVAETIKLLENSKFYYIVIAGMDGNYSYVNNTYQKAFNHVDAFMVGKPYYITMHPGDLKVCEETSIKCFENPDRSFPATIRKHDGEGGYIITQWEYRAIFDDNNNPAGIFCLGHDITAYSLAKQELKSARTEISKRDDLLEQISWDQSHIIRKPVANILGLISIIEKMDLDQNLSNICAMLSESTAELDEVVKSIVRKASGSNDETDV